MIEWGQKSKPQKIPRVSNKTPRNTWTKIYSPLPPPQKKTPMPNFRAFWIVTALETPKNIFGFINNIMQNDNFKFLWIRKKSCVWAPAFVNQATQPLSQDSLLPVPKEREPGNEVESHPPKKSLSKFSTQKTPKISNPKKSFDHSPHLKS